METARKRTLFKKDDLVYDMRDTYLVLNWEVEGHVWNDEDRIIACQSLSTGEIVGRHEYEIRGISQYFKYRNGNVVMYSENGNDEGVLATLFDVYGDVYSLRVATAGPVFKPRQNKDLKELYETIMPIWLTSQVVEKLGFTTFDNGATWSNGYIKLYAEYPAFDSKPISRYRKVELDRHYSIELVHDQTKLILTGANGKNQIRTVHELQNTHKEYIKFPLQTLGLFL